jgi:proteasome accessory factor A
VPYQISQRADFIVNDCFQWVQHNRAILNLRDEPLADPQCYRRLHLIHGDTNVLPSALFLKVGATRLVLDMLEAVLEADEMPPLALVDAVTTFRLLSRVSRPPWRVNLADGKTADAVSLLRVYLRKAKQLFLGRDEETDAVLRLWSRVLNGLATDPSSLVGLLDWPSKEYLLSEFRTREGIGWNDPWLESQDLEFHQVDPERSYGLAMANCGGYWNPVDVVEAKREPPQGSRAFARSRLMREIQGKAGSYYVDWSEVSGPNDLRALLLNPFEA